MKKLFAVILSLLLIASLSVTVFATGEDIPSPTDKAVVEVEYISYDSGSAEQVSKVTVSLGETLSFVARDSDKYEFVGFTVEGEYEVVSGGEYIIDVAPASTRATRAASMPTLVLTPLGDVKVTAHYNVEEVTEPSESTEPTAPTVDDDEDGDSPQTGDDMLVYCIAGAVILGVIGFAFAGKQLLSKKKD